MLFSSIFAPDDRYDREHASDFQSRYGAYLRQNVALFLDGDTPTRNPLEFAAAAWRVAQPPVMSPPYVVTHPRVVETTATWDCDGLLAIATAVAAGVPRDIARALHGPWRGWNRSGRWSEIEDNDQPAATSVLQFRVPMSPDGLPQPTYSHMAEPDTDTAKYAVEIVCGRLNSALCGVFAQFDRKEVA